MIADVLFWVGIVLSAVVAGVAAVRSLVLWVRSGFRAPVYIHAFALVAVALGAFITYGGYQDEGRIGGEAVLVLMLPALVYWAYVAGGGPAEHLAADTLEQYPNGVRAGTRLRLRHDLPVYDDTGRPTGAVHRAGEIWRALPGRSTQPDLVRLEPPDGRSRTWDGRDLLQWFEPLGDASG